MCQKITKKMNKIYYWRCTNKSGYNIERIKEIKSLKELLKCFEGTNLLTHMFAAFKDGGKPLQEDKMNKVKLTYKWDKTDKKDYEKFIKICWEQNIFEKSEVNGIYCSKKKISIWLNKKCDKIKVFEKLGYQYSVRKLHVPDFSTTAFKQNLNLSTPTISEIKRWTIGYFDTTKYKYPERCQRFHHNKSEEILFKYITNFYQLTDTNPKGMGTFMTTNILQQCESRKPNVNNRFVYSSIRSSLKNANSILLKLFLSLPFSIFPKISNIYLAFCFYHEKILQIGIYLTGNTQTFKEENGKRTADDSAIILAHKLKQIILEYCNPEEEVVINVSNSVPLEDSFFTDSSCEFKVSNPTKRVLKV